MTFLTLAVGLAGLSQAGFFINHIDIAPQFAGVLMGITNIAGTLPGFLGPQIAKLIAQEVSVATVNANACSSSLQLIYQASSFSSFTFFFPHSLVALLVQSPT